MCGVAGIVDFNHKNNTTQALTAMLRPVCYRGPDESGIWHSEFVALGNVRLSILDLTTGRQPLSDPSGRFWIAFNGEIFNYIELRHELSKAGNKFRTNTDTEVVVQLYAKYGVSCLQKLNGQFVIAIWDKLEKELFVARDRVGVRPLFYNLTNGVFAFGSEIKSLFSLNHITRELVPENLAQIYTFWTAITPNTPFKGIFELSPGHFLRFNKNGLNTERFWQLDYSVKRQDIRVGEAIEEFDELFASAVRLRLRADVEVAAFLSGGIDSSTTVSYIKKVGPRVLNTFSIGFSEKDFDESAYQEKAARYFNTNHKSVICTSSDIAEVFPKVVWQSETAMTRTAPAPMMILSKLVRDNNIKVVITGEGSDEILAGYDIFREDRIRRFWAAQPDSGLRPSLLKKIYPDIPHLKKAGPAMLKMFFGYRLSDTSDKFYSHLLRWNNSNHIKKHLSAEVKNRISGYSPLDDLNAKLPDDFMKWDPLARAQWLETTVFMSGYLLSTQGDRMGMANSIEGRYPFLDHRVIEFCSGLPADMKLKGLNEKYLLKKLTAGRIPENIRRRPKQPYRAPIQSVFLSENPPEYVREMLSETYTRKTGIFDHGVINETISRIRKTGLASEVDQMAITAVISTHILNDLFIENNNGEFHYGDLKNLRIIEDIQSNSPNQI